MILEAATLLDRFKGLTVMSAGQSVQISNGPTTISLRLRVSVIENAVSVQWEYPFVNIPPRR